MIKKIKEEMVKEFVNFYGNNIVNESTLIIWGKRFFKMVQRKKYFYGCMY